MKKIIFLLFVQMMFSSTSHCQEFLGVKLGMTNAEAKASLISNGFVIVDTIDATITKFNNIRIGDSVSVYVVCTPVSKTVWKMQIRFDPGHRGEYIDIQRYYEDVRTVYVSHLGMPTETRERGATRPDTYWEWDTHSYRVRQGPNDDGDKVYVDIVNFEYSALNDKEKDVVAIKEDLKRDRIQANKDAAAAEARVAAKIMAKNKAEEKARNDAWEKWHPKIKSKKNASR